jgi:octanoyl-[GcvH]:protein N-octanoyltransferase
MNQEMIMTQTLEQLVQGIRWLNHAERMETHDPLWNHAVDEGIAHAIAAGQAPPTLRLWRYHQAFMLGRRDERLPGFRSASEWACAQGFDVAVRPSGGACVILDQGVLNVSLILPSAAQGSLSIRSGFEALADLLVNSLKGWSGVEIGEVHGSYCPGEFDLAISGYKFSGIAQRRIKGAIAIQAFLLVEGRGEAHAAYIAEWYERAGLKQVDLKQRPLPEVRPETIRSLNEHGLPRLSMEEMMGRLHAALQRKGIPLIEGEWTEEERANAERERRRFSQVLHLPSFTYAVP